MIDTERVREMTKLLMKRMRENSTARLYAISAAILLESM